MVAFNRSKGLTGSLPPIGAALAGMTVVAVVTLLPAVTLESLVWASGIAALVPAAEPPLGVTARTALALAGGFSAAAVVWSALYLLFGPGGFFHRDPANEDGTPSVRRADAHPDAPPRRPMSAADLGTPLMEVVANPPRPASVVEAVIPRERTLPADLDERLAAFDPAAIMAAPEPSPQPAPARPRSTAPALEPGERLETFELTPVVRLGQERTAEPKVPTSLAELLARLERGAERRAAQG